MATLFKSIVDKHPDMKAQDLAKKSMGLPVPIWLRNAPTKMMQDLGFGKGQKWEAGFHLDKNYLPDVIKNEKIFQETYQLCGAVFLFAEKSRKWTCFFTDLC